MSLTVSPVQIIMRSDGLLRQRFAIPVTDNLLETDFDDMNPSMLQQPSPARHYSKEKRSSRSEPDGVTRLCRLHPVSAVVCSIHERELAAGKRRDDFGERLFAGA